MIKYIRPRLIVCMNNQKCSCSSAANTDKAKKAMPTELTKSNVITSKVAISRNTTKEDLEWRTPWHKNEGKHYSALRTFYTEDNNVNVLKYLQMKVDLSPSTIKNWWLKRKEQRTIALQQYIPERNQMLGNELAAAHFIVHRGGSVKFFGEDKWIKANDSNEYDLPGRYQEDKVLQAIDCTDVELYYEGVVNFRGLRQLEWFSINGCEKIDDWGLDRISSVFSESLLYLDIRNCPLITYRGLCALYKMENLKILYVDEIASSKEFELTYLMLQEVKPDLDIREE